MVVAVSCEDGLKLLNHNLCFFFAGIVKLSHLFQGGYTNAILTFGFDISSEWFGVVLIKSFLNDIIDVVDLRTLEGRFAVFLE